MDKPLIIILIEEYVKNQNVAAALIRIYNNLNAQIVSAMVVLVPIVLYALYEVFVNLRDVSELLDVANWKVVAVIIVQQLLALWKAGADKLNREVAREAITFADTEGK